MADKVLFISADQWRGPCLSLLNHPNVKTPNLDRLAGQGVSFLKHFTVTLPCGPARASLLTGLYAMNHRSVTNGTPLDARLPTLPFQARAAGYSPLLYGYSDTSADPRTLPPNHPRLLTYEGKMDGFDWGLNMTEEPNEEWLQDLRAKGYAVPEDPHHIYRSPAADPGRAFNRQPAIYKAEDSDTAFLTDRVIADLKAREGEAWFLHLVYLRPHPPLIAPAPYHQMVDPDDVEAPIGRDNEDHPLISAWRERQAKAGYFDPAIDFARLGERDQREMRAVYYGLIAEVDSQIGRILDYLEASGQAADTLVIFTCDHGEMLGDHGLWGKMGWYDQAYHIPLIIRDPKHPESAGRRISHFTESVDLAPTILDWLGRSIPPSWDGVSLLPWLRGESPAVWRQEVFFEFDFRDVENRDFEAALGLTPDQCCLSALRDERWKYVHFAALPPLLYDLEQDPQERRNLAGDPAFAAKLAEMAQRLLSHRMLHSERSLTNVKLTAKGPLTYEGPRRPNGVS